MRILWGQPSQSKTVKNWKMLVIDLGGWRFTVGLRKNPYNKQDLKKKLISLEMELAKLRTSKGVEQDVQVPR